MHVLALSELRHLMGLRYGPVLRLLVELLVQARARAIMDRLSNFGSLQDPLQSFRRVCSCLGRISEYFGQSE